LTSKPREAVEVLLVADHDIDILGDLAVDFLGLLESADVFQSEGGS